MGDKLTEIKNIMDEGIERKLKICMKELLVQDDRACRARGHFIIQPESKDLELTREVVLLLKLEDIHLGHCQDCAQQTRGDRNSRTSQSTSLEHHPQGASNLSKVGRSSFFLRKFSEILKPRDMDH